MNYEKAFEALNTGDYQLAAQLLETAVAENAYASDMVNHAYTLALYRTDQRPQLADVAFRVGSTLVSTDPASAMDYFQRSIHAGLDASRIRCIGEVYEDWFSENRAPEIEGPVEQVAHVVGAIAFDGEVSRHVKLIAQGLLRLGIESTVFTTEPQASWFFNPGTVRQTKAEAIEFMDVPVDVASADGDFLQRAERIAAAIRSTGAQLVFYHGNLSDQIMARVAAFRPAAVQINVNYDLEMDAGLFDGFIHLRRNGLERTRYKSAVAQWIPSASDIDRRLELAEFETRETMGIESATTLSASFCGPTRDQLPFVKALIEIMTRFPEHFHLFIGNSDVRSIRGLLHSEGVLPRVRFLGQVGDITPLLGTIDIYLVPFPEKGSPAVLDVMGAGKPIVAMRHPSESEFNAAAELISETDLTPRNQVGYIQTVDRLLRDSSFRARLGNAMFERFNREFRVERMADRYLEFIRKLESPFVVT